MTRFARLKRSWLIVALASVCLGASYSGLRAEDDIQLSRADAKELWRKGSNQILAGAFNDAAETLDQVDKLEPGNKQITSVREWLHSTQELNESRENFRQKMYDYYVKKAMKAAQEAREFEAKVASGEVVPGKAKAKDAASDSTKKANSGKKKEVATKEDDSKSSKKSADKASGDKRKVKSADGDDEDDEDSADVDENDERYKWSKALLSAHDAMVNAKDEDAFRAEPWLPEIVTNARKEIERHKTANEWRDALALYSILQMIYPDDKEYEDGFNFCRKRAHLEFVYGKKSTWRTDLAGIQADVVPEILARMDQDYVETPDYRKLSTEALEHLEILAEASSLSKTFPTLGDKDLVEHFVTRLKGLVKMRIDATSKMSVRDVRSIFNKVMTANRESIALPENVIVDEFVSGLLEPLDEFTAVIWPAEVDEFNKQTRGEFVGVGIQITQDVGEPVRVESPLEDSPAYTAGIKPGDFITQVDGKSTVDMTIRDAVRTITGEPGTKVKLTIKDPTTDTSRDVELRRQRIKVRTVRGNIRDESKPTGWDYFLDKDLKIGYVRINGFMDKTVDDLEEALEAMNSQGCRGVILDLRFNPGGLLTSAVNMCDLFLKEDAPIVETKGRNRQQNMTIRSRSARERSELPMVVLVNEYSASASEIVTGALAGLKQACVVGVRTFGKGSVQNLIPVSEGQAYLKLTTAHYYVPDKDMPGEDQWYLLHRKPHAKTWGIDPHVQVKLIPQEISKVLRLRRERDLLKGKDQAAVPKNVLERRPSSEKPEEFPEDGSPDVDPQLVAALNIMRIKVLSNQPWTFAPRETRALSVANKPTPQEGATAAQR